MDEIESQEVKIDSGPHYLRLTGITSGEGDMEEIARINVISDNPDLVEATIKYPPASTTATVRFHPKAGQFGKATLTVTVIDANFDSFTRSFAVTVLRSVDLDDRRFSNGNILPSQ